MAEPATSTAAGVAIAAGAITITGSFLGLQYDALLFGFAGGLISLMHLKPMPVIRVIGTLLTSSLLGASLGPIAAAWASAQFAWFANVPPNSVRLGCAVLVGVFIQALIPLGLGMIGKRAQSEGAQP